MGLLGSHVEKIEFEQSVEGLVESEWLGRVEKGIPGGRHRAGFGD